LDPNAPVLESITFDVDDPHEGPSSTPLPTISNEERRKHNGSGNDHEFDCEIIRHDAE
jgi:hypothetical protein